MWLLGIMDDEQNPNRANIQPAPLTPEQEALEDIKESQMSSRAAAARWWDTKIVPETDSWILRNFAIGTAFITTCTTCHRQWYNFDRTYSFQIPLDEYRNTNLENLLSQSALTEKNLELRCRFDKTKTHNHVDRKLEFARLPPILSFTLKRFRFHPVTLVSEKINTTITFPPTLNMDPYVAASDNTPDLPKEMRGPFEYDCYAVCQTSGASLNSGHYWAIVKDWKKDEWYKMNDQIISRSNWAATQSNTSYMVFYKRRG